MPSYKLIVMTQPVEGREQEYNDWYAKRGQILAKKFQYLCVECFVKICAVEARCISTLEACRVRSL
jgi:hypothetical protein